MIHLPFCCNTSDRSVGVMGIRHEHNGYRLIDLVVADDDKRSTRAFCAALGEVAETSVDTAESIQVQAFAANTIRRHAHPSLWDRLSAPIRSGHVRLANCVSEENTGSDLAAIELAAVAGDEGYVLTGTKTWVAHGPDADELIVYARTGGPGLGGITAFLVDAHSPGVIAGPAREHLAGLAIPVSAVKFDGVVVPTERILGRVNRGARVADILLTQGRIGLAACALGLGRASLDEATRFAKTHHRFGRPVIEHQGVGFKLADIATRLEAGRHLLHHACDRFDADPDSALLVCAQAKLFATDTAMAATTDAVQVLGASAYLEGSRAEERMRQAKILQILQGTNEIQRRTIAASLVPAEPPLAPAKTAVPIG